MSVTSPSPPPDGSHDDVWPAPSRATDVLDQLLRERQRRPLFRRRDPLPPVGRSRSADAPDASAGPPGSPVAGREPPTGGAEAARTDRGPSARVPEIRSLLGLDRARPARRMPRVVLVVALVALVPLLILGRHVLQRPAALDTRLPIASEESAGATASTAPVGASPGAAVDGPGGSSTGTDAVSTTAPGAATTVMVHVAGAVASPGVVRLPVDARVVDAVSAAGGLRADADPDRVNLAAPLVDGSRVVVPSVGQPPPAEVTSVPPPSGATGDATTAAGGGADTPAGAPVDLNTATVAQLDELPGVGPTTAQAIVDHRTSEGPFTSVDSLLDVRGIGDAKLAALRDLVTVG